MGSKVIVALDAIGFRRALNLARILEGHVAGFKVNDELTNDGVEIIKELSKVGLVMADAKLHDIDNTNRNYLRHLVKAGADIITLHASMGARKMRAAKEFVESLSPSRHVELLAVTVLTDMREEECQAIYGAPIQEKVLQLAEMAAEAGMDGVVCSPAELAALTERESTRGLLKVTPNIRPSYLPVKDDDQNASRKATESDAIHLGADLLVVGRAITQTSYPVEAAKKLNASIAEALAG